VLRKRRPHPLARHPPREPGLLVAMRPVITSPSCQRNNTIITVLHHLAGAADRAGSPPGEADRDGSAEIKIVRFNS
jgi:hypothetical protein